MKTTNKLIFPAYGVLGLVLVSAPAAAAEPLPVSEPGLLSLLGMGMVLVLVAAFRKRRK